MIRQARAHIDALEANGGTMMADAVARVCATPADDNRLRIVTFMTDGYVGNDFEVLGMVQRLRGASRWFPFGTGNATNRFLLDHMARLGGGETEHVLLGEPGDVVAGKFWERIGSPVLTDVRVDFEGLDVVDVYPSAPADVWADRPLVIHARYRGAGRGRVVLRGFQGGRPYEQALDVTLPARHAANAAIASMWARAKVEALMDRDLQALQSGTYPAPLREEIVRVALAHRILTPFTSFVAVEDRVVNEGGTSRTVQVPVEMPDGVEYEGIFGNDVMQEAAAAPAAASVTGRVRMASKAARQGFRALDAAEPATIERRDADEPTLELDDCSVRKLGPALRVLVEQGPEARGAAPTQDGWARVRVRLRTLTAETRRALEEAGLVVQSSEGTSVTGLATPAVLQALVRLEAVVRIETVP
jgi:Ca-activated chloride channel family protein